MMMRITKRIALPLFLTVGVACFLWFKYAQREPKFHGRPLTVWMHQLHDQSASQTERAEAMAAITNMHVAAVSYLAKITEPDEPRFKQIIRDRFATKHPFLYKWFPAPLPGENRRMAIMTLGELGPLASNAIPALEWSTKPGDPRRAEAREALVKIRGESVAQLVESMESGNSRGGIDVEALLTRSITNAHAAVPALCHGLSSTNEWVSSACTRALGQLRADADISVPALEEHIKRLRSDPTVSPSRVQSSLLALSSFREEARSAIPLLKQCQQDQDTGTRVTALISLSRILNHEEAREMLTASLEATDQTVRGTAARLLQQMESQTNSGTSLK